MKIKSKQMKMLNTVLKGKKDQIRVKNWRRSSSKNKNIKQLNHSHSKGIRITYNLYSSNGTITENNQRRVEESAESVGWET